MDYRACATLNKTSRAGADPEEDGGAEQSVQLLPLGLALATGSKDSSTRGVCIEASTRSLLVPKC
jgi:hypothetical protein